MFILYFGFLLLLINIIDIFIIHVSKHELTLFFIGIGVFLLFDLDYILFDFLLRILIILNNLLITTLILRIHFICYPTLLSFHILGGELEHVSLPVVIFWEKGRGEGLGVD